MNGKLKFRNALAGKNTGRPPLWVMRQAGRYLPEYKKLKQEYSFLEMVKTPELAKEVSLQPLKRFDLDAVILFSDILVIPEAMGQPYHFRDQGGIEMEFSLKGKDCVHRLEVEGIEEKLSYMKDALLLIERDLMDKKALLGFCGSPWTLACYMIQGGSAEGFPKAVEWATHHPKAFEALLEKISFALRQLIEMQMQAGVDALQIFDSWHSLCPKEKAWDWSLKWIKEIVENLSDPCPLLLYAKSSKERLKTLCQSGVSGLSLDHGIHLRDARSILPCPFVLQGNVDPAIMETNPELVRTETMRILDSMREDSAHILNLGHGIRPNAKIECMEALVETNLSYPY